jgi:hypothetical protein
VGGGPDEGSLVFGDTGRALTGRQRGPFSAGFWAAFLGCLRIFAERRRMCRAPVASRIDLSHPNTVVARTQPGAACRKAQNGDTRVLESERLLAPAACCGTTE